MLTETAPPPERALTGGATISVPFGGGMTIPVAVDADLVVSTEAHYAELQGFRGALMVMVDTYDSNPAAGEPGAGGQERWVRVLDIAGQREVFHRHVVSAINRWTVDEPILTFAAEGDAFTIHRLGAPEITVVLDADAGTARAIE